MVLKETKLEVLDNSGGLKVKCFHVFGGRSGKIGSKIIVSVKTFRTGRKVRKGEVFKAIIIQTKNSIVRTDGSSIKFSKNGVVLWKRKEESPIGTRVLSFVPFELRFQGYLKIVLMSFGVF